MRPTMDRRPAVAARWALAAAVLAAIAPALAEAREMRERQQQNLLLRAEWERARAIGGYEDPFTALRNLFSGNATERTVQPMLRIDGSTTIQELRESFPDTAPAAGE